MSERPYPLSALASRRAPRLHVVPEQRALNRREQKLLLAAAGMLTNLDIAHGLLVDAVRQGNPERCTTAVKALMAIGLHLNDYTGDAA